MALSEHEERPLPVWDRTLERQDSGFSGAHAMAPPNLTAPHLPKGPKWTVGIHLIGAAGLALFVTVVLVLHGLRGDLNPAAHTISEYSLGRFGWLMRAAFAALGIGVLTTAASLFLRFGLSRLSGPGLLLLVGTAVGLFLDAGYNTDHPHVLETADGRVHGIGMLIVCLTLPTASLLLGCAFAQRARTSPRARQVQVLSAAQIVAIVGFEMSPLAVRGILERVAITMAVVTLVALRSVTHGDTDVGRAEQYQRVDACA